MRSLWLLLGAFVLVLPPVAFAEPLTKQALESEEARLSDLSLVLRSTAGGARTVYVATAQGLAFYVHDPTSRFHLRAPEAVEVKSVSGSDKKVEIKIESERLGKQTMFFFPPPGRSLEVEIFRTMIDEAFEDQGNPIEKLLAIANLQSRLVHARGANHLPSAEDSEPFATLDEALDAGYSRCSVCFATEPLVREYSLERFLRDACAAQVRQYSFFVSEDSVVERVRRIGHRVLEDWPIPLRGYDYEFYVVEKEDANATACPAGKIFVTTGLLGTIESDLELESILAHEIAHVERRHGYRQYKRAVRAQNIAGIIGVVAGAVIGARGGRGTAGTVAGIAILVATQITTNLVLFGYSRREEGEADSYGLAYLDTKYGEGGSEALVSMLSKLQYASARGGFVNVKGGPFASHPGIADRVSKAKSAKVRLFDPAVVFGGYDDEGRLLARILFHGQMFAEYNKFKTIKRGGERRGLRRNTLVRASKGSEFASGEVGERVRELILFASVESTAEQVKVVKAKDLIVYSGHKKLRLDNKEDTEIYPVDEVGMNFILNEAEGFLDEAIDGIELRFPGVTSWMRME